MKAVSMGGSDVQYCSQYGQDEYLDRRIFKGKRHGVFVDVGASDGVTRSNTYFFEKARGWTGLCIEPREDSFQQLRASRNCRCECACISSSSQGKRKFLEIEGWSGELSGLIDHYHPRHLERVEREVAEHGLGTSVREVPCLRLGELLQDSGLHHVDLCSIDVEGAELHVLTGIDFAAVTIDVFVLENPYQDLRVRRFLAANGYRLAKRIQHDEVYLRAVSPMDRLRLEVSCSRAAWVLSILRDKCSARRMKRAIGLALAAFRCRERDKKGRAPHTFGEDAGSSQG